MAIKHFCTRILVRLHYWHILVCPNMSGWLGVAKVLGILRHRGVQLILASSWARPAILVAVKGRGWTFFFCFFTFTPVLFLPCPSLSSPLLYLLSLFSLSLGDDTKWPTRADMSLNHNTVRICRVYMVPPVPRQVANLQDVIPVLTLKR